MKQSSKSDAWLDIALMGLGATNAYLNRNEKKITPLTPVFFNKAKRLRKNNDVDSQLKNMRNSFLVGMSANVLLVVSYEASIPLALGAIFIQKLATYDLGASAAEATLAACRQSQDLQESERSSGPQL